MSTCLDRLLEEVSGHGWPDYRLVRNDPRQLKLAHADLMLMMALSQTLFLPMLALALALFFPLFERTSSFAKGWRSRRKRQIYLGRMLVFVLLLATVVAELWPIDDMDSLTQGLLVTGALMFPPVLVHIGLLYRYGHRRNNVNAWIIDGTNVTHAAKDLVPNSHRSRVAIETNDSVSKNKDKSGTAQSKSAPVSSRVHELVIEQRKFIDSERKAHHEARTMTRDAMIVMRRALAEKKRAQIKAERERLERQKLEQEYKIISHKLLDVSSINEKSKKIKRRQKAQRKKTQDTNPSDLA